MTRWWLAAVAGHAVPTVRGVRLRVAPPEQHEQDKYGQDDHESAETDVHDELPL
jgi:hypothetical protein